MDSDSAEAWRILTAALATTHVPRPAPGFGRVRCEVGWSWTPTMRDYDLWLVLAGRGRGRLGDRDLELRAGSLLVFRPGDRGTFTQHPKDRLTVAYCHFEFVDPATSRPTRLPDDLLPEQFIQTAELAQLAGLMQRLIRLRRDTHPLRQWEASAALAAALAEVYRQDALLAGRPALTVDPRVQDALDHIADNLHRRPTLAETAAAGSVSPSRLSRLFAEQLGTSFRSYVLEARLERAHQLLTETSMSVTEIARALGYPELFLFSRQFRQRYGQPPTALRRADRHVG